MATIMKESAGTLLYKIKGKNIEVLLVHASGNYNRKSAWSIPKGLPDVGESFEAAARRETLEETGIVAGALDQFGFVEYKKSRKRVHCFVGLAPAEASPKPDSWEVDRAEFVKIDKAVELIHPDQLAFIEHLKDLLTVD